MNVIYRYYYIVSIMIIGSLLMLSTSLTKAQHFCFNMESDSPNAAFNSSIKNFNTTDTFYLKLYIHVIRDANGDGGQTVQDVETAVNILAQDFNPHHIYFVRHCDIDYIDSDVWFQGPWVNGSNTGIYSVNNHTDGIDAYLFPDVANANGGRANGVGGSSEFWVAGTFFEIPAVTSSVISHEMGHCLNLWHTHHSCESGVWENTDGSNCTVAGDFVCDTPADPFIGFNVDELDCTWKREAHCETPEPIANYKPDTKIIMAYTLPNCMAYFTDGQGQRMRSSINILPYLQSAQTTSYMDSCICLNNITFTQPISGLLDEEVSDWIVGKTNNVIEAGANVTYNAGDNVGLKPGFKALQGSRFHAFIEGCVGAGKMRYSQHKDLELTENKIDLSIYPNPANHFATINYQLPSDNQVSVSLFDAAGRQLYTLAKNQTHQAGQHQLKLDASNLATGMYYLKLQSKDNNIIKKLMIAK